MKSTLVTWSLHPERLLLVQDRVDVKWEESSGTLTIEGDHFRLQTQPTRTDRELKRSVQSASSDTCAYLDTSAIADREQVPAELRNIQIEQCGGEESGSPLPATLHLTMDLQSEPKTISGSIVWSNSRPAQWPQTEPYEAPLSVKVKLRREFY